MKQKMKPFCIIIDLLCISTLFAQVTTPNGTPVDYRVLSEGNVVLFEYQAAQWLSDRGWTNLVTKIGSATQTYNCHSYAWYKTEGGVYNYWINAFLNSELNSFNQYSYSSTPPAPKNINKYWNDFSYVEVPAENEATKVWFGSCWQWSGFQWVNNCDHSATRLSSGLYESKWGAWPLYRHPVDKCPYNINNRKYYKQLKVSGPSSICNQSTYTIDLPPGATIQWSTNNNNISLVSGQGTGEAVFRKNSDGTSAIQATLQLNGQQVSVTPKNVWGGTPIIDRITGQQHYPNGGQGIFQVFAFGGENISYSWAVYPTRPISFSGNRATIDFPPTNGDFRIEVTVSNGCGSTTGYYFVATGEYEPY